jgi:hypothetical protein
MRTSKPSPIKLQEEQENKQQLSYTTNVMVPLIAFTRSSLHNRKTKIFRFRTTTLRNLLVLLTLFAVISLSIDGFLVSLISQQHSQKSTPEAAAYPTMIPTSSTLYAGQIAFLHLAHFAPNTQVFLSRDLAQSVRTDTSLPFIHIDANGNADVRLYVEDNWNVGIHYIQAEDVSDHFTASTVLHVIGTWLVPPPNLEIQSLNTSHALTAIDMGSGSSNANTLQSLLLRNTGGSVLSWTAHSDQPWLQFTPTSGVFSSSERIYLGIERRHLKAGHYTATLTIQSNAGEPIRFLVHMQVQPLKSNRDQDLIVSPLARSLTAIDGDPTPLAQTFSITNGGKGTLTWSLKTIAPTALLDQNMIFLATTHWLDVTPEKGTLAPGATTLVRVVVHSQHLLPSVYGSVLQFASDANSSFPQSTALSLTVLPRCGLDIDQAVLSFTTQANAMPSSQILTAHRTTSCTENMRWGSYTPDTWFTTNSAHGTISSTYTIHIPVSLQPSALSIGTHTGFIILFTQHRSQTVIVTLNLLASSAPPTTPVANPIGGTSTSPAATAGAGRKNQPKNGQPAQTTSQTARPSLSLALSTSTLTFTLVQGQQFSATQSVSIENMGADTFVWSASTKQNNAWINLDSITGTLEAGQTNPLSITVDASDLPVGTYSASTTITALDSTMPAASNTQTIAITLTIVPPCTLNVSPSNISFTVLLLQPRTSQQSITLTSSGYCPYPLTWTAQSDNSSPWLTLSTTTGNDNGGGGTITASINASGLLVGIYKTQIEVVEVDKNGDAVQNNPQIITVTLTVVA